MTLEVDAAWIAAALAVDPYRVGGVCLRGYAGEPRDQWLQLVRYLAPASCQIRRVPLGIADSRLLGGLDLAATLRANKPIGERGVLANTDGGIVVVAMAERMTARTAGIFCDVLDRGAVHVEREGVVFSDAARVGVIALDEGIAEDEAPPQSLIDRLAFQLDFTAIGARTLITALHDPEDILAARELLPHVVIDDETATALCATALGLGAGSPRVTLYAVQAARIAAALEGRRLVTEADAVLAGRLVLAPRASVLPAPAPRTEEQTTEEETSNDSARNSEECDAHPPAADASEADPPQQPRDPSEQDALEEVVLAATKSAIPRGLLAQLRAQLTTQRSTRNAAIGRVGAFKKSGLRGRPSGVRSGAPGVARLNVIETLRAAAPWQRLRGRRAAEDRLRIMAQDFRITKYKQRTQTLTVFAVDASGSSALNRLAETKGAVELLLADCYIRRDQVAVIAFRGQAAQILLPPTRSLVRAKRSLAGLPGGGGTPLASAIDSAVLMAMQARRRGETATVVFLTDGRANVGRNGVNGREAGQADALHAAGGFRAAAVNGLFIDTSPRPQAMARDLAARMNARYLALPFADAQSLSKLVQSVNA